jgi:hypothetical protein
MPQGRSTQGSHVATGAGANGAYPMHTPDTRMQGQSMHSMGMISTTQAQLGGNYVMNDPRGGMRNPMGGGVGGGSYGYPQHGYPSN